MAKGWRLKVSSEKESKIIDLYKRGYSMQKVAMITQVTPATVLHYVKPHISEKERRQRQFPNSKNINPIELKKLYEKGFSSIAIAKKFKISYETVFYHLRKLNVNTSKNGKYASKIDNIKLKKIIEIYKNTKSILKTARQVGLHPASIHYRLRKLGLVKQKFINQKIAKKKYKIITNVLLKLFKEMNYEVKFVQHQYNGHGPDMLLKKEGKLIVVEHKALIKNSYFWTHAIEEASRNIEKFNADFALVVSTALKPKNLKRQNKINLFFYEDIKDLLIKFNLRELIPKIEYISSTPSV